ncbi:putative ribosomal protein L33 [Helianthus annuus]|uniref:Large ribosomal subunit protein bL33c n=1 Tax=Helianthus annuus TaxID=4232 RepID=A0A9K3J881_HELAN|nr:putative ribosomal protein L33 [Helianthus annuus]KAJ0931697.1 putative ribosomal protein L33 [Helianthus annuus]
MGLKKKSVKLLIRLISSAKTGFFYVKRKNPRMKANKLEIKKYDPRVRRHVLFTEAKINDKRDKSYSHMMMFDDY